MTLDTRQTIEALFAKYFWAVDTNEVEGYLSTWHPDGISNAAYGSTQGHEQLRARFVQMQSNGFSQDKRHFCTNFLFRQDTETSFSVESYLIVIERKLSPPHIVATGTYSDQITFENGAWKFKSRKLTIDPSFKI